jgi:hypothetical protein
MPLRKKNIKRIKSVLKDESKITPDLENLGDLVDKAHALSAIINTEGGQILIDDVVSDIINSINYLTNYYKTASQVEILTTCAFMKVNLDILHKVTRANKNYAALNETLKEAIKDS